MNMIIKYRAIMKTQIHCARIDQIFHWSLCRIVLLAYKVIKFKTKFKERNVIT